MKKYLVLFFLIPLIAFSQRNVFTVTPNDGKVIVNFSFSDHPVIDTSFMFKFADGVKVEGWSAQAEWFDLDTTGIVSLEVSNIGLKSWEIYYDSLHVDIIDTTGHGAIEDNVWNWKYGRYHLVLDDTCSTGIFSVIMNFIPK